MRIEVVGPVEQEYIDLAEATILSLDRFWEREMMKRYKNVYYKPRIVLYHGKVTTDCGLGMTQHGPFYCSGDRTVYVDPRWFKKLEEEYGARVSPFVISYTLAHEVGHYVQSLRGTFHRILSAPGGDSMRVRGELQADYWAGCWARHCISDPEYPWSITEQDVKDSVYAASRVGDDTIQSRKTGTINQGIFGHGTAKQRQLWFIEGMRDKDPFIKDPFSTPNLDLA